MRGISLEMNNRRDHKRSSADTHVPSKILEKEEEYNTGVLDKVCDQRSSYPGILKHLVSNRRKVNSDAKSCCRISEIKGASRQSKYRTNYFEPDINLLGLDYEVKEQTPIVILPPSNKPEEEIKVYDSV